MPTTASIGDLRNHFPKVRKLVETEGEVLRSENGRTRYRLTLHPEAAPQAAPPGRVTRPPCSARLQRPA